LRRQAAICFGVSAASETRRRTLERAQGHATSRAVGGDRRSTPMNLMGAPFALVDETQDIAFGQFGAFGARGLSAS
jgi:hypothetical protein